MWEVDKQILRKREEEEKGTSKKTQLRKNKQDNRKKGEEEDNHKGEGRKKVSEIRPNRLHADNIPSRDFH